MGSDAQSMPGTKPGKDIALFGGIPLLPAPAARTALHLRKRRLHQKTGTIALEYDIVRT